MEPGLYVTFFSAGEPFAEELPPVGPLEHLVVRDGSIVADRKDVQQSDHFGSGGRWLEAELELQRAIGREPGGARRPDLRIGAPQGVYLRFVSFDEAAEHEQVPELGPYAVIVVGRRGVEADGELLATRTGPKRTLWELTPTGGTALAGIVRPDICFRTRSTAYHPQIKPFRQAAKGPVAAPATVAPAPKAVREPAAPAVAPPATPAVAPPQATRPAPPTPVSRVPQPAARRAEPEESAITLRSRLGSDPRPRFEGEDESGPPSRDFGSAAWRMRFVIIGALVVLIAVFSLPSLRALVVPGASGPVTLVGFAKDVNATRWTYSVTSARRVQSAGAARARGVYLVVQLIATNRGDASAQVSPANFMVVDADGNQFFPILATSNVYAGPDNSFSPYVWTTSYPVGRAVATPLIFDINPAATGTQLAITDVPSTRIRLE